MSKLEIILIVIIAGLLASCQPKEKAVEVKQVTMFEVDPDLPDPMDMYLEEMELLWKDSTLTVDEFFKEYERLNRVYFSTRKNDKKCCCECCN